MTQEQKAKAYDEVVGKLKVFMTQGVDPLITRADVQDFFPELKESERERDERIRKALLDYFGECEKLDINPVHDAQTNTILAWLEKATITQKDFAPKDKCAGCNNVKGCVTCVDGDNWAHYYYEDEQKATDKVEPKFHKGDWVIDKQGIVHKIANVVENVTLHTYGYDIVGGGYFNDNTEGVRLWTIQDAKEGDVLCYETENELRIFIYIGYGHTHYHCCYYNEHLTTVDSFFVIQKHLESYIHPATKEQRDLLFQKMKEAGYEWDAEKKELKKIDQKSAWSEEDERMCQETIDWFEKKCFPYALESENPARESINWLNSLKERITNN